MSARPWLIGLLALLVLAVGSRPAAAQEAADAEAETDSEAVIEQILQLRAQLEALLSALPPELRDEVERRWQAQRQAPTEESTETPAVAVVEPSQAAITESPEPVAEAISEPEVEIASDAVAETGLDVAADSDDIVSPATPEEIVEPACVHLAVFDTNDDRVVSAGDKYWRYLRLWNDNGDGVVDEELEIDSLFELDIRHIRVELDYYSLPEEVTGDIELGDEVRFVLFNPKTRASSSALLVVQAGRMSRGGEVRLADAAGETLSGYQPISPSIVAETEDGRRLPLLCR